MFGLKSLIYQVPRISSVNFSKMSKQIQKFNKGKIVWMDMEMTGLDAYTNRVLEVAMLVTDEHLKVISPDFHIIINQPDDVIDNMNAWCKENLKELAEASRKSDINEEKAQELMLEFIKQNIEEPRIAPLAGNSIYMDRTFLRTQYPKVDEYLHYRVIDVSTVKELCGRWNKKVYTSAPQKLLKHRAIDDVRESINEMNHYKEKFFVVSP